MPASTLPGATYPVPPPLIRMPIIDLKTGGFNAVGTELFMEIWAAIGGAGGAIGLIHILQGQVAILFGMHGDATITSDGTITVTGTNGVPFGPFATGTDAADLTGILDPARIADGSLPFTKFVDETESTLLGRLQGSGDGVTGEIVLGTNLSMTGNTLNATGGGGSGTVTSVATGAGLTGGPITNTGTISFATIADGSLLANISGGVAVPTATTPSALLDDAFGNTRGDLLYRGASVWAALAPGATANLPLVTGGAGADPAWATNVNVPGWLNVGATGAPANTTAGDLSSTRLFVGPSAIDTVQAGSLVYAPTAYPAGTSFAYEVSSTGAMDTGGATTHTAFVAIAKPTGSVSTSGSVSGVSGRIEWASSGTLAIGLGVTFSARATNGGTITDARAADYFLLSSASSVITTGNSVYIRSPSIATSGTVGTAIGVNIQAQKVTGVTSGYGIKQFGTSDLNVLAGATAIGTTSDPTASAALDVNSTTGALMIPRMTSTQRLALTPSNSMMVYDTTLSQFYKFESGIWSPFASITTSLVYADGSVPAGNTVANTVTETTIASTYSFPAASLQIGDVITIRLAGLYSTTLTPNLTLKIKLGGTTLVSTGTFVTTASLANAGWDAEATFIVTATGTSGKIESQGAAQFGTGSATGIIVPMTNTAPITINTTLTNALTVTLQWGTASTSDTITCREMTVWLDSSAGSPGRGASGYGGPAGGVQSTLGHATKGYLIDPQTPLFIYGGFALITWATPQAYKFGLYSLNSSFTIQSVLSTVVVTPASGTLQIVSFTFPSPQLLSPGTLYGVACTRTDSTTTAVLNIQGAGTDIIGMPASAHNLALFMDSINPGIGNTFTSSAGPFAMQLAWST